MAILKPVINESGIPLMYHRISSLRQVTNGATQIQVCSYLSEAEREREKEGDKDNPIYCPVDYYQCDYIDGMTCSDAYEYLKTLPEFKGATDILEDTDV